MPIRDEVDSVRKFKIIGFILGGLFALVALLLIALSIFVNPNDYKGRIEREVKASTGRDLNLQGDIKLSVFPWIALQLGSVSLGNSAGFGTDPFLSVKHAALRVRLLPLLRKELQVGKIEIDGLDLRLKKNAAGKGNWEDFGQKSAAPESPEAGAGSARSAALQDLGGVLVKDSRISYDEIVMSNVNLEIGNVAQRATAPVKASFDIDTGPGGSRTSFKGAFDFKLDTAAKQYGLAAVELSGELQQKSGNLPLPWKFAAPSLDVDLGAQTLKAPTFSAQAGAARLAGSVSGDKIVDAPALRGSFKLEPLMPREIMAQLGTELPKTRDDKALSKLAASTDFKYAANAVHFDKLDLQLDDTQLRGALAITNLDSKATTFDLNVDHIDLDRYRSPESAATQVTPPRPAAKPDQKPVELPIAAVRALRLSGNFSVGTAKAAGLALSNMRLTLEAKDGVLHVSPIKASLYGGEYSGDITYDAHEAVPSVRLDQQVTGMDMAPLLKDGFKSERLSGRGSASTKLAGAGRTSDELIKNMSGRVDANLTNGAVNGIDLWFEISRAQALLKQQAMPAGSDDRRTKFDAFKMSADLAGGIATTKDLIIASQYLRATGTGSSNLLTKAIDYHIVATILKAPPSTQGSELAQLTLADIPVEISGTMDSPKVLPDLQGILKSKLKQKLQDTIQDKLKGILGR
jgi:AsmA protein